MSIALMANEKLVKPVYNFLNKIIQNDTDIE